MIEIDNISFECFVVTIFMVDHKVLIIAKLYKKLEDIEKTIYFYVQQLVWNILFLCLPNKTR